MVVTATCGTSPDYCGTDKEHKHSPYWLKSGKTAFLSYSSFYQQFSVITDLQFCSAFTGSQYHLS